MRIVMMVAAALAIGSVIIGWASCVAASRADERANAALRQWMKGRE